MEQNRNYGRRLGAALLASAAAFALGTAALAVSPGPLPPDTMVLSPGGVDLRSGVYKVNKTLLSIGADQAGGIDFRRITRTYGFGEPIGKMGQFNHNWDIRFRRKGRQNGAGTDVIVTSDELSYTFLDGGTSAPTLTSSGGYATLTRTNVGSDFYYTLTTADGTVVVSRLFGGAPTSLAASVTKASGARYALTYDTLGPSGAPRLLNVVSNAGYALMFEYYPNSGSNFFVSKVCVLNLTQSVLPTNNLCPAGASTVSYAYSGQNLTSETDATGAVWGFSSTFVDTHTPFTETYSLPGSTTPYLTVNYDFAESYQMAVISQLYADNHRYDYYWTAIQGSQQGDDPVALSPYYYTENGTNTTYVSLGAYRPNIYAPTKVTPGPTVITDPLNRTTLMDYCLDTCSKPLLQTKTLPDGMQATYLHDTFDNIYQTTITPNTGSLLPSIVTKATFDCSNMVWCNKPTTTTDGNQNVTTYTYSPVHGQILTKTGPAVGGVNPQTRYSYTQRYAWIANGSGGYVQTASPIWLLTQESFCKVGAPNSSGVGCALAGDEVITTYDYGPNNGPNNLLLRGKVEDAGGLSLRTCYTYDQLGRKISETAPRAGLTTCS
jgi:hypothetical protein